MAVNMLIDEAGGAGVVSPVKGQRSLEEQVLKIWQEHFKELSDHGFYAALWEGDTLYCTLMRDKQSNKETGKPTMGKKYYQELRKRFSAAPAASWRNCVDRILEKP